jgi:hypothetical protein
MNQDFAESSGYPERPYLPPQPRRGGPLRWTATLVALVALVAGAYLAYLWLVSDVARRRAAAEQAVQSLQGGGPDAGDQAGAPAANPPQPTLYRPVAGEPVAPAVVGGALNRCLVNGEQVFTNGPCPAGSSLVAAVAVASAAAPSASGDEASQQAATCAFLSAELSRLDYEFHQPLPPPVLDDISTRLTGLRAQSATARCAAPAKPPAPPASAARRAGRQGR